MKCLCGSEKESLSCCKPFIEGTAFPKTAEELMRSRYVAHVEQNIEYLKNTTAPEKRSQFNEEKVLEWSKSEWLGLKIIGSQNKVVEFMARYKSKGDTFSHHEVSNFRQIGEKWYFVSGHSHVHQDGVEDHHHHHHDHNHATKPIQSTNPKIERNDPCPCGSGKKYKKCCGAN